MIARWRKSSASGPQGNCVEVAALPDGRVGIRNSRDRDGAVLVLTRDEFATFLAGIRAGELDDLVREPDRAPVRVAGEKTSE